MTIDRIRTLLGAALVALFVTLLGTFFALAGVLNMALAQVALFVAFLVGVIFVWFEVLPNHSPFVKLIVVFGLAILLSALDRWVLKQERAHVYISRTSFQLDAPPPIPNYANVFYRNESNLDVNALEWSGIEFADFLPNDIDDQRNEENKLWRKLLDKMSHMSPEEVKRFTFEVPAHGERKMTLPIPIDSSQIRTSSKVVYYYGRITYTDKNGSHYTEFCTYMHNNPDLVFYCSQHNQAP